MANILDFNHLNLKNVAKETIEHKAKQANIRDAFYEADNYQIRRYLYSDLCNYMTKDDASNMKYITLDFYLQAFLDKICSVYDEPIKLIPPKGKEEDKNFKRLRQLLDEVRFDSILQSNLEQVKLHNTILNYVRYNQTLDRVYIQNKYNVGTCYVQPYDTFYNELKIFVYQVFKESNDTLFYVWNREKQEHYMITDEPRYDYDIKDLVNAKIPIDRNSKDISFQAYFPIIKYQYRDMNDFWGRGLDSIVELIRMINVLLTVCGDDSIRETIRILILNFDPYGTKGTENRNNGTQISTLKTGLKNPIVARNALSGDASKDAKAQVVSADLFVEDIIKLIEKITDIISALHNVDNVIKSEMVNDLSGIALRIKNEPLLRRWRKDINVMKYSDRQLLETVVKVNNYHRGSDRQIDEKFLEDVSIEYTKPTVISDEKADYELKRMKWEDGFESMLDDVIESNDAIHNKEMAKKYVLENRKEFEELTGVRIPEPYEPNNVQED